jgi:hypothetical protein
LEIISKDVVCVIIPLLYFRYNIPEALVVNNDETAAVFVNRARVTRDRKGNKRVRVIGVGAEKAQITTTLAFNAEGDALPYQTIWCGKTTRCQPPLHTKPSPDVLWSHTASHWQNEKTYLTYLKEIIVPFRLQTVARLGLPQDQKMLLKHDLHYSHKDETVLRFCEENHIMPLFVPAKCTDVLQECDLIANSTFKCSLKREFRDWLAAEFDKYTAAGKDPVLFNPKLTMGVLKPLLPQWIHNSWKCFQTPDMKTSIAKCFKEQGLFGEMRDPATLSRVFLEQFQLNLVPDELEVNDDDFIDDLIGSSDDVTDDLVRELLGVGLEEDESSGDEESSNDE